SVVGGSPVRDAEEQPAGAAGAVPPPIPPAAAAGPAFVPAAEPVFAAGASSPRPPRWQTFDPTRRIQPDIRVTHWWSGRYAVNPGPAPVHPETPFFQQAAAGVRPAVAAARGS